MLRLIEPTTAVHSAWLDAHLDWGPGRHEDGFGLVPSDEVISPGGFSTWVARLLSESGLSPARSDTGPRGIYRWIVDGDTVVGGIALRTGAHPSIPHAGHIGYGIRPSARGRGIATWALGQILEVAREYGIDRVLLICEDDNRASATTIQRNGGVTERSDGREGRLSRYWIALS
jgi:predicted acetyltransferase